MPIVIEHVIVEFQEEPRVAPDETTLPAQPVPTPDKDLARTLALLRERQERLRVD